VPRQRKRLYLRIDFERLRPIRPVQEVRIVTKTPVGVLRAIVILPRGLQVAVVQRLPHQTSTGKRAKGPSNEPATAHYAWITLKLYRGAFTTRTLISDKTRLPEGLAQAETALPLRACKLARIRPAKQPPMMFGTQWLSLKKR